MGTHLAARYVPALKRAGNRIMEKEMLIQCVPAELFERLKGLLERLWEDKNPAAVHLNALLNEFDVEMKSLEGVVQEYEADYASRLSFMEKQYKDRIASLENELSEHKARVSSLDSARIESASRQEELSRALKQKETELADFRAKASETEAELNLKYAARMQELYDRVNKKETDMIARWEEKNKTLDGRLGEVENDYAARVRQLKLKEKALEDDFNSRKAELIKTFDRIRLEFEAREESLSAAEKKSARAGGA